MKCYSVIERKEKKRVKFTYGRRTVDAKPLKLDDAIELTPTSEQLIRVFIPDGPQHFSPAISIVVALFFEE